MNGEASAQRGGVERYALPTFALSARWLFGIGSVLALYVGRRSLRRMKDHPELRRRTVAWAGIPVAILGIGLAVLWLGLSLAA